MLQLYFWPMACSLASRIALMEAGIEARYHLVHLWTKKVMEDDSDFWAVSPKGAVPVLVLENGERLTENAAVLQYIADLKPELGLAPPPGEPDRYRLQEWLAFVGYRDPQGVSVSDLLVQGRCGQGRRARADRQERVDRRRHLADRPYLVGERFTVADAYLTWSLLLLGRGGVDVAQWPSLVGYLARMQERPQVKAAIDIEMQLRKTVKPLTGGADRPPLTRSSSPPRAS